MFSQRLLRIKVMQSLYQYFIWKRSYIDLAYNEIKTDLEFFQPTLVKDFVSLLKKEKNFLQKWLENLEYEPIKLSKELGKACKDQMKLVYWNHQKTMYTLKVKMQNQYTRMIKEMQEVYFGIFEILIAWFQILVEEFQKENFLNPFMKSILEWIEVNKQKAFKAVEQIDASTREWYFKILMKNTRWQNYILRPELEIEDHRKILVYLVKKVIFEEKTILQFLHNVDLQFLEHKIFIKKSVVNTLKKLPLEKDEINNLGIDILSDQFFSGRKWFYDKLFRITLKNTSLYEQWMNEIVKNWEVERMPLIDKLLIQQALTEIRYFKSIPYKVVLDEYIEIAKLYGDVKSSQFINGILDNALKESL